ncbi:unnamed protein product [Rotaria sp. Silwood2]|nr:unnamed protein product [Rotaria sp. Silwood2]CAF3004499.1 unnamed protein product [Rotaria sp. Silwood2]CAF3418895.1 unnamed protein product [Rotaria sp. Silwood2]CAF3490967.1 unnamed protein product [Rotaria sp. Silwood2]CAF4292090.1 unnamed protein product [Rotaria sp. Silwood2]
MHLANKLRPDLDIQFYSRPPPPPPPPATQTFFQTKDPIMNYMKSDAVYYIKCKNCEHSYIGKTERQCLRRLHEHGAPKTTFQQHQQQDNHVSDDLKTNNIVELRRSSRIKNKLAATVTATALRTTVATTATSSITTDDDNNDKKLP